MILTSIRRFMVLIWCLDFISLLGCSEVSVNMPSESLSATLPVVEPGCYHDPNTGQVFCPGACQQTITHSITVAKHKNLQGQFDADVVSEILGEMKKISQEVNGPGDVSCNVHFKLDQGVIGEISNDELITVDTFEEYKTLMEMPEWVKVIQSMYVCGPIIVQQEVLNDGDTTPQLSHIAGCGTDYPWKRTIVEYDEGHEGGRSYDGVLWVHEVGHTRGNTHTIDPNDKSWIMYFAPAYTPEDKSQKMTCLECVRYLLP